MHPLTQTVYDTITKHHLLQAGDTVLVALSGGADSVALLHCMLSLQTVLQLREVRALHVHHGLRGSLADRDEQFVMHLCNSLHVPLKTAHVDTIAQAELYDETIEEAGRRLRYAALGEEAVRFPSSKILTAHTADDQAETVLMRFMRGCGTKGLSGIPICRGNIVRPLLYCTAEEVRNFCKDSHLDYVVDETNADESYTRNFVRRRVMAPMKEHTPAVVKHMAATAATIGEENRFLESLAVDLEQDALDEDGCLRVSALNRADPVLIRRVIRLACERNGGSPERFHIEAVKDHVGKFFAITVPGSLTIRCSPDRIEFDRNDNGKLLCVFVPEPPCEIEFGTKRYTVRILPKKEFDSVTIVHKNVLHFCVSYDMIGSGLCLRSREQGDRIRPIGRRCSKSLKKWMNEQRVPRAIRDTLPVLCDSDGVLAVLGRVTDERAAVSEATETVLFFEENDEF